jgi:uncharacterized protein (TIGR03437 family)
VLRLRSSLALYFLLVAPAIAASLGSGSPSAQVEQSFINAYNRGQFPLLVLLPPLNDVHALGSPGLVQEFTPKGGGTGKYALVKPDPAAPVSQTDTLQISSDLYALYTSLGVSTAGYPTNDTSACPVNSPGSCTYQFFTKNYALFVYAAPSVNIAVRDPFYTAWVAAGGLFGIPGAVTGAETTVSSPSKVQAVQQLFNAASAFSYPVGSTTPTVHSVIEPFNSVFNAAGGVSTLGLPTSEGLNSAATGITRQTFEYGRIEQTAGRDPAVLWNLSEIDITYASLGLNLNAGASATVAATTLDIRGSQVNDRVVTWTSTNGAVVKVTGNGYTATVQAVGGGAAAVYATSEGKTSAALAVRVGSVCCGIGEGAPLPSITQAFQTAVSRNNLSVALPASFPVIRQGAGYLQTLTAADGSGTVYVVAQADNSGTAWILTGGLYSAYLSHGGFTGALGYPASDPLPGTAQRFTSGAALAGSPVRVVPAAIASKWFQLGAGAGISGSPLADAAAFSSFSGIAGLSQAFSGGVIFGITGGASTGQAWFSTGAILSRYLALAGPAGTLGVPTGDISLAGALQTQSFEAGYIDLQAGAPAAVEHFNPRHPAISLTPATVVPGGRVHIGASGFAPGATLAFTITGQPGFSVQSSATVTIQAAARTGGDAAAASYTITSVPALLPKFSLLSGDRQTGAPGALLPLPLTAVLLDSTGAPIAGVPVSSTVSPGASLQSSFVTDPAGRVSATFRLPSATGVAVGSFAAGGQVVAFSALGAARSIQGFPAFTQADAQGGLTAALAALLRFAQNSGTLGIPNGSATPAALRQFLSANNGFAFSETGKSIPNPWVAAQFAQGGLFTEAPTLTSALDLVNAGTPVIALLDLAVDGNPAGSAAVSLTGVNADGSLAISDPNPAFARSSLQDYLAGFVFQGRAVQGSLRGILRIGAAPFPAGTSAFVIASPVSAAASASSAQSACPSLDLYDPAVSGQAAVPPAGIRYQYCEGTEPVYELDLTASRTVTVTGLAGGNALTLPANGTLSWQLSRTGGALTSSVQPLSVTAVTDSAAFTPVLAPGSLMTIFGSGFSSGSTVTAAGRPAPVIAVFPFQINAQLPPATPPGTVSLQVAGALGTAVRNVTVSTLAPGIFVLGGNSSGSLPQGAIVNLPDASINSSAAPAVRGQYISVYTAGLGVTTLRNGFQITDSPVSVVMNSIAVTASFAGLLPGFVGLYQINVQIPTSLPPTLNGSLAVQAGTQTSNTVAFAVQ